MQIMIVLRFYATGTFQSVSDWRFIWCQFVADVKENPGGGGRGFQSQLNIDGLTLAQL